MPPRLLILSASILLSAPTVIHRPRAGATTGPESPSALGSAEEDALAGRSSAGFGHASRDLGDLGSAGLDSDPNLAWKVPGAGEVWRRPLPGLKRLQQRLICRSILTGFGRQVVAVHGWERLAVANDPFVVVLNHSTRLEAVLLPILFAFLRNGALISFVADWNFALIPGVATVLREGETILLVRKPAKPAILNRLKPFFTRGGAAFDRAEAAIRRGRSVGIFPEGTTNRHPGRLLRGFDGAARLSLKCGCPVLPVGVRFPGQAPDRPISDRARMELFVGETLRPPDPMSNPDREEVRRWHARIMNEIGRLSGKHWEAGATRRKHHGLD